MKKFNWSALIVFLIAAPIVGYFSEKYTGVGFWPAFGLVIFCMVINGWISLVDTQKENRRSHKYKPTVKEQDVEK